MYFFSRVLLSLSLSPLSQLNTLPLQSLPTLETTLDIAKMKLDKVRTDSVTEHAAAEKAMQVTEAYCDDIIVYAGDITLATHGLEEISTTKEHLWNHHNNTIASLKNDQKNEILRKIHLAQLEVELHQKLQFLQVGCPSAVLNLQGDALPSSTVEGSRSIPSSERCTECGGVTTKGFQIGESENGELPTRMYCAWKEKRCWEIDFLTGVCQPPEGLPSKCYRSNLLDPDVVKAVDAYQATKQGEDEKETTMHKIGFEKVQHSAESSASTDASTLVGGNQQEQGKTGVARIQAPAVITGAKLGTQELRQQVEKNSEYVGKHFVPKLKNMLKVGTDGEKKQMYGEANDQDAKQLIDSGVELTKLPPK